MVEKENYKLLLRSFDEDLDVDQAAKLKEALNSSEELQAEQEKILAIRNMISSRKTSFMPGFKDRVLNRIREESHPQVIIPDFNQTFFNVFKKVALTGVAAIAILLFSIYYSSSRLGVDTIVGDPYSDESLVSYLLYDDIDE